ncbi:extensin [Yinghuangia sp. ASG 101]|uniref:extensin n=1 Tax=Yinghuangia sp. ASG 101 TaxID=2896848 RepID=UPI001E4D6015|nr:extensin [Yinghuangia sp. ASG 101]UGQ13600.1 extensin [Yinghuangia sp. ASG 101]
MNADAAVRFHGTPDPAHASEEQADEARALLRTLTRALAAVAVLALSFTAVNVTQLAVRHDVPLPTALLLDPMLALALATTLTVDARLAELGAAPPGWAVALRWFAGLAAWTLNVWESVYPAPSGPVGVPSDPDPTGIVLHSIPCALLVLVSEAVAAYRRRIRRLLLVPRATARPGARTPDVPGARGAYPAHPGPAGTPGYTAPGAPEHPYPPAPDEPEPPDAPDPAPGPGPDDPGPETDPLYDAALDLDRAARDATGRPITIRALRTELRIGQARARALRDRLDDHAPADHDADSAGHAPNTPAKTPT